MSAHELKAELARKRLELNHALRTEQPYAVLKSLYEELKRLEYNCVLAEIKEKADAGRAPEAV